MLLLCIFCVILVLEVEGNTNYKKRRVLKMKNCINCNNETNNKVKHSCKCEEYICEECMSVLELANVQDNTYDDICLSCYTKVNKKRSADNEDE